MDIMDISEINAPVVTEHWRPESEGEAAWVLRKLKESEDELLRVQLLAEDELERVRLWQERLSEGPRRDQERWTALACDYVARRHEADEECKTIHLPTGTLTAHRSQGKLEVADPVALQSFAEFEDLTQEFGGWKWSPSKTEVKMRTIPVDPTWCSEADTFALFAPAPSGYVNVQTGEIPEDTNSLESVGEGALGLPLPDLTVDDPLFGVPVLLVPGVRFVEGQATPKPVTL